MKYKHGFLALLSTCVLTVASVAQAEPGGAAGAAGSTAAGAGGASAGAAGTGTAGTGTAGTGTAGTGTGVAGSPGAAVADIGKKCAADADCGGGTGKCLTSKGKGFFDGGPANGYCTVDCTDWLKAVQALPETGGAAGQAALPLPYPCQPDADINTQADNAKIQHYCLNISDSDTEIKGTCVELCEFGNPEFTFDGKLDAGKCKGRNDVGCYPLTDDKGELTLSFCRPACQSDAQCGSGSYCDRTAGVCQTGARPGGKLKNGEPCDVPAQGATESPCEGYCVQVSSANPGKGTCFDPCIADDIEQVAASSCGGLDNGLCLVGLFNPLEDGTKDDSYISFGKNDYAACLKAANEDSECDTANGFLVHDFAGGQSSTPFNYCYFAQECQSDLDCAYTCTTAADCLDGDTCENGKCMTDGEPNGGLNSCQPVAVLGCGKYCVDHDVDPNKTCGGSSGAGGKAGAGQGGSDTTGEGGSGNNTSTGGKGGTAGKAGSASTTVGAGGSAAGTTPSTDGNGSSDDGGCSVPRTGGSTGSSSALLAGLGLLGALVSRRRRQG